MKKILCILLTLMCVLGLCACKNGGSETHEEPYRGLQAGFGREVVMPEIVQGVHINGTDTASRICQGFLDHIKVTCIALRDEAGTTILIYTCDMLGSNDAIIEPLRTEVSKATGIAEANIMFAATHTHSAPAMSGNYEGAAEYRKIFSAGAVKAGQDAIADLSPAELSYGSTQATGLLFVRHYVHDDGKVTASSGIKVGDVIVGHPTEADEELQILRLTRPAEGKKDILLLSWNSHPTFHGGVKDYLISADFPGPTRDYIESQGDYLVAYFTGDAGNQAPTSAIREENHGLDYKQFGEKLGNFCLEALPNLTPAQGSTLRITAQEYPARANKERLNELDKAQEIMSVYNAQGRDAANALAEEYGFYQFLEARAVINRSTSEATKYITMHALAVGENVSVIFAPYEMFTNHGHQIRVETPYDITFVSSCSNGGDGYIPSKEAYEYGCYESYVSYVAPGTGEELVTEYLNMLNQLKTNP